MPKHIADKDHAEPGKARVREYTRIERESKPSKATKKLQTRPETREGSSRLKAYTKIERGEET